jgi:hypothetical protein
MAALEPEKARARWERFDSGFNPGSEIGNANCHRFVPIQGRMARQTWVFLALSNASLVLTYAQDRSNIDALGAGQAYDLAANWILDHNPRLQT